MAKFNTLVDIFQQSIATYPDNELFGTKKNGGWEWTRYLEFGRTVDKFRAGLESLGVQRGDRVACVSNNRVEWAVAAYACFGLGAAFVPMYEAQHPKDWEFITKDCDAKVLICATDAIVEKAKDIITRVPSIKAIIALDPKTKGDGAVKTYAELLSISKKVPTIKPSSKDTACLIYTSGTTGNPKGVILSHGNIASNVSAVHEVFPMSAADRSLSFLPWAHSFGQTCELHCLFSVGASMALCPAVDKIIEDLGDTKPTLLFSVPRIFNKLYAGVQKQISEKPGLVQSMVKNAIKTRGKMRNGDEVGLSEMLALAVTDKVVFTKVRQRFGGRLKYAFSGGAAISRDVAEFIDGLGITVYEGYGLTETSPITTANWPGSRRIGSVGRAIPGVRVEISAEGEIVVYGPNVMQGYHNRGDENAAVFTKDGGFRTGDMGKIEDGFVYITGRIKEQYKLENGKYVVPTPLEEQFKLSPFILNAMVYGDNKPYNVALIVADTKQVQKWGAENGVSGEGKKLLDDPKVKALFKKELDHYGEKFKGFEEVRDFALIDEDFTTDNGMLTPSLKVKRRAVLEKWSDLINGLYTKKKDKGEAKPEKTASA
jgi:long-chain acyl-CoA synthetase